MIKRLRKRFIRISVISVTLVMLLLCLIVNVAHFLSVDSELTNMLDLISENQGRIPSLPSSGKPAGKRDGPFTKETPYDTRYFVLRFTEKGELINAQLDSIASVTEEDTDKYLSVALKRGEGYGYLSGFKYRVVSHGENRMMAVFLDCYREGHSLLTVAVLSFSAMTVCVFLVYLILLLLSRRAIDPVVKSYERQKQFITDAGHELTTPITVIATSLKVLEMEVGQHKWIDKAQTQAERLIELVNSLVSLSKMDEEDSPLHFAEFAVSDAVSETAESFRDYSVSRGHSLNIDVVPGLKYIGDEYAVRQLVSILLDNAIRYADPDSAISFFLEKGKRGIVIRTENQCEKLNSSDLPKLFDRFYRTDASRSADSGGFGLGLSVARGISEGHGGDIRAEMTEDHTVVFRAELR